MLKTGRLPSLKEEAVQRGLLGRLKDDGVDALIVIGGDGSFRGAMDLVNLASGAAPGSPALNIVGIPGTIDNNIYGSDYTLGHDTALNKLVSYIDDISDTGRSLPGRVFFVETLGAWESYFPQAAVLMGMADFSVLCDPVTSNDEIVQQVAAYRALAHRDYVLAVFAEETHQMFDAAALVKERLGLNVKCNLMGFMQRGGVPTARDRLHAAGFAKQALSAIKNDIRGKYVVYHNGLYAYRDFADAKNKKVFDNYGFNEDGYGV
jgi:6-phosphofructokinase 1